MKYKNLREEEIKNKVAQDFFWLFDCSKIIGNIDFCVSLYKNSNSLDIEEQSLVWAEAKAAKTNIYHAFVQLILTIGKARSFDKHIPPAMLAAFDAQKIAFIAYSDIYEIFYQNDFNWNVTPSNHDSKEFKQVLNSVEKALKDKSLIFDYENDEKELKTFIKRNFAEGKWANVAKIRIDKNNFMVVYNKWLAAVKPSIAVKWDNAKKSGIIDGDFYLADLLAAENKTLKEKLYVLLESDHYELDRQIDESDMYCFRSVAFFDKQEAHTKFWNKYERPPKEEYWDYIIERRDLLVPQDIRERKGSFFTPQIWVEKSQEYLADVLGENWQDEYYIWDCCAGTGNLLSGLTNKYNIWASTLDQADVAVMHDRVKNGANLLDSHIFQFDFLNDEFLPDDNGGKIPRSLYDIISNPEKRKKLLVYINPPYAEAATATTVTGTGKNKAKTATDNRTWEKYKDKIKKASNELFAQFFIKIYCEIPGCILGEFSTLKHLQASNFEDFRNVFRAKLEKCFIVPADTFDNVSGKFPIGFLIWNTDIKEKFTRCMVDVYERNAEFSMKKNIFSEGNLFINKWYCKYYDKLNKEIGVMNTRGNDFQNQNYICITTENNFNHTNIITKNNLITTSIYFSVRHCIEATWLNDRDQFLYPNAGWASDLDFQGDCLAFTLLHGQNRISVVSGEANHWIPYSENDVDAKERFASHFMHDFINGKIAGAIHATQSVQGDLFGGNIVNIAGAMPSTSASADIAAEGNSKYKLIVPYNGTQAIKFSAEAQAVMEAGRKLWRYYHSMPDANPNAAFYDIRRYFQGVKVDAKGKERMNNDSKDEKYNALIKDLREKIKVLAKKIELKVYEYGFLK